MQCMTTASLAFVRRTSAVLIATGGGTLCETTFIDLGGKRRKIPKMFLSKIWYFVNLISHSFSINVTVCDSRHDAVLILKKYTKF